VDALQKVECKKIFTDKMTGSRMDRPDRDLQEEMLAVRIPV
jgi:hypothetical protein